MDYQSAKLFWRQRAEEEALENSNRKHQHGRGICSVFILDTSESMEGEGHRQMKKAFLDILNEYAYLNINDNVAVIGCGEEVKFLHYYSKDYYSIKKCIENVECKGHSPLEAALTLARSCTQIGGGHTVIIPPLYLRARVVVITDGNPTVITRSFESLETSTNSEVFQRLLAEVVSHGQWNPFTFIPVGNAPNYRILGALALASKGGRLIGWQDARQYARLSLNFKVAGNLLCEFRDKIIAEEAVRHHYTRIARGSEEDIIQVCEILNERDVYKEFDIDHDYKERYSTLPCVGTRVRKNRDWRYDSGDCCDTGTVIGHREQEGWINVEWDDGSLHGCRYTTSDFEDPRQIEVCNEPRRIPDNQTIATGCLVRQGRDWKWGDQNGTEDSIGIVYRVIDGQEVYVRWPNGNKCNYRFGYNNKYDLILCDPTDPEIMARYMRQKELLNHKCKGAVKSAA
ncbi:uncharacterized protein LOC111128368 [Crassostrea virginica]